jgi:SIR2-like protein
VKALIVGAGATIEECLRSGVGSEVQFPLISNFAEVMWKNYLPHPFLHPFLESKRIVVNPTGRQSLRQFLDLERSKCTNVEEFFEFAWNSRNGFSDHPTAWNDLLRFGFLVPITAAMLTQFKDGAGWRPLQAGSLVSALLSGGDLVVNLNYDTVFEMAVETAGKPISYLPNFSSDHVMIAKPHGSVNLLVNERKQTFCFGRPQITGTVVPTPDDSLAASILPPHLNKHYSQHPIARAILDATRHFAPDELIFWGVGFTQSDLDLNALYARLAMTAEFVSVINPDIWTRKAASEITQKATLYFPSLDSWLRSCGLLSSDRN